MRRPLLLLAAAAAAVLALPVAAQARPAPATVRPAAAAPSFDGIVQAGCTSCGTPPTPSAAIGPANIVEVANYELVASTRTGTVQSTTTLQTLFGITAGFATAPQVVYDPTWDRWIVTAGYVHDATIASGFFLAVSATGDPNGAWRHWTLSPGGTYFPVGGRVFSVKLGMDQDALVLVTYDTDANSANLGTTVVTLAKARVYNGFAPTLSPPVPVENGTSPAIVGGYPTQQDGAVYLLAADASADKIEIYAVTNAARPSATKVVDRGSAPDSFDAPTRNANQPGTDDQLTVGDGSFEAPISQLDGRLWFAHTVDVNGFPTVQWGYVNPKSKTAVISQAYHSSSSDDFRPSIVAISDGSTTREVLTWSYTDIGNNAGATDVYAIKTGLSVGNTLSGTAFSPIGSVAGSGLDDFGQRSSTAADFTGAGGCGPNSGALVAAEYYAPDGSWRTRLARVGSPC